MKHLMIDMYGVTVDTFDAVAVNEIINNIIIEFKLKAVMPAINLPYYYCKPAEDGGVTSFCLLDTGHITLHTFPFYGACFLDIMFEDFDVDKVKPLFDATFKPESMTVFCFDRDNEKCPTDYDSENRFGPHVLVNAKSLVKLRMSDIYTVLETVPDKIDMHAVMRPVVVTNKKYDFNVISGIVIIAESHISFHYNIETDDIYFDIYSCKFCDPDRLKAVVTDMFGNDCKYQLISRGEKLTNIIQKGYSLSDNGWRNNI